MHAFLYHNGVELLVGTRETCVSDSHTLYWDTPDASLLRDLLKEGAGMIGRSVVGDRLTASSSEYVECLTAAARVMMRVAGHALVGDRLYLSEDDSTCSLVLSTRYPDGEILASVPASPAPDRAAGLLMAAARGLFAAMAAMRGLGGMLEDDGTDGGFAIVGASAVHRDVFGRVMIEVMAAASSEEPEGSDDSDESDVDEMGSVVSDVMSRVHIVVPGENV